MEKMDLLAFVDANDQPDAIEAALSMDVAYPAAAMGLLRLVRQGLATRYRDPDDDLFWYELTEKGEARLDYLENAEDGYQ